MPMPRSVVWHDAAIAAPHGVTIVWDAERSPLLDQAGQRFLTRLVALGGSARDGGPPLTVHVTTRHDPSFLTLAAREHYTLDVQPGAIRIAADGETGVLRAFATLLQMIQRGPGGVSFAGASIDDAPRFAWRGSMVDSARHFMQVATLKRHLDAMEMTKLNVLHWHLSDGAAFRIESLRFPRLQAVGGHGEVYTRAQIRDIVAYARDRGIRVVPEIDVPGHTLAILQAYPALAAHTPDDADARHANLPAMDPTNPATLTFVTQLFAETESLFPDRYVHAGGDEVQPKQWTGNPAIMAFMKAHGLATPQALQATFTNAVAAMLSRQGKIMIAWDEVSESPLPRDVVVQAWRSSKFVASATAAGHPVIVSAGYYLDLLQPSADLYAVDPLDPRASGLTQAQADRIRGKMGPLVDAFTRDPTATLSSAQATLVLGGEAPLWAEIVSDAMMEYRMWPRMAALAERFWSPATQADTADMLDRLPAIEDTLCRAGLQADANHAREIALLSPDRPDPIRILADATSPVRYYAHNLHRPAGQPAVLDTLADVAQPDALAAVRFNRLAVAYRAGDHALAPQLRAQLTQWHDNDDAIRALAASHPALQNTLMASAALRDLAQVGLDALAGHAPTPQAHALLARMDADHAASANMSASMTSAQPAGDLLVEIAPGIRALAGL
ncbi:family 20 glycosylhydrolase [Ameyamaea chiangmaiensis]|uniref:beta-N-acetylhexosaminidase n=2 Tax=Ameyamaea chiangmaiensis TaxID=442969 RepID=A0A850PBN8_9PROT|nr:family 20 glycosylhydrolase [Ameyamaea chiangmaiensis]NVN40343.1 family 20 glycosylhydrolase [Ameyamaea chiangmaiensis]